MLNVYGWSPLVYEHMYIYCWNVFNNLLPFPVLQPGAWCYYCDIILSCYNIRYHGNTRVTFLSNNSTIWHHNSTIWHHNSSTMMRGQYWKILPGQYGILSLWTITDGHVTRNRPISIEYLHLTYNNTFLFQRNILTIYFWKIQTFQMNPILCKMMGSFYVKHYLFVKSLH